MKKNFFSSHKIPIVATAILGAILVMGSCLTLTKITLPTSAKAICTVTPAVFASWFVSGTVAKDGVVKPANSVTFPDVPNCSFYEWSEQMFMWLTSPTPPSYGGGGGRIFASPAFFTVSPPDASGNRTFLPNTAGGIQVLNLRAAQFGPNRLPVITELNTRQLFEIVPPVLSPEGKQMILNEAGERVEIDKIEMRDKGKPVFFDRQGQEIRRPRPIIPQNLLEAHVAQKFQVGQLTFFLGSSGNVIETEPGQAGGGEVLMAQNGSLVYYITTVNQVYAYFLTGAKNGDPLITNPSKFPTTQAELNGIITYASNHGKTLVDPEALAIEVKSSWVEASSVADPSQYITMKATIPSYNKASNTQWIETGHQTVTLALVGIHVVGSTKGHPEMIWATFEHESNTPNRAYSFTNSSNTTSTEPQNTAAGNWLFSKNGATGPFNQSHMFYDFSTNSIMAISPNTISPTDIIREFPWGKTPSSALSNTEVISMNNSVRGMIASGDVRSNYIMTGATWTIFGAPPNSGNQVGTNQLANSTMETFQIGSNCFSCHVTNSTSVSHVFGPLKKLF